MTREMCPSTSTFVQRYHFIHMYEQCCQISENGRTQQPVAKVKVTTVWNTEALLIAQREGDEAT